MSKQKLQYLPGALLLALGSVPLLAQVTIPHTFQSGDTALASEVNANFTALKDTVETMQAEIGALQTELASVQDNAALDLDGYVDVVMDTYGYQTVRFTGVNLQVVNGVDQGTVNGVGNLIVGYNERRMYSDPVCSDGQYDNQSDCQTAGETWSVSHKSGSHNIVGGSKNAYSSTGGLVVGTYNAINRAGASVSGGLKNIASGQQSSVSGGIANTASGELSSISGGDANIASGWISSISGGSTNTASGSTSSILGGDQQEATTSNETVPALP